MAKVMLATGMIVAYGYLMEAFMAWYSQNPYETFVQLKNRPTGPYAHTYWMMLVCNVAIPQLLWSHRIRASVPLLWLISIAINIGMWLERYVIVVTSLHRDFLPSSWSMYHGTFWDYSTFYGTLGLFLTLIFLFIRFLPVISITEMRELVHETEEEHERQAGLPGPNGATS
jgi:molybdopterin-containing oxidoreductase family membrane subunit